MHILLMNSFIVILAASLIYFQVFRPVRAYYREKARREFLVLFRDFQTHRIKEYYPELRNMNHAEIRRLYNVSASYEQIGRS